MSVAKAKAPAHSTAAEISAGWRWLAPMLGCLLLALIVTNPRNGQMAYLAATGTNNLLATMISNRNDAAYIMAESHSRQNALAAETFAWTNGREFTSSKGSFLLLKTNTLLR